MFLLIIYNSDLLCNLSLTMYLLHLVIQLLSLLTVFLLFSVVSLKLSSSCCLCFSHFSFTLSRFLCLLSSPLSLFYTFLRCYFNLFLTFDLFSTPPYVPFFSFLTPFTPLLFLIPSVEYTCISSPVPPG
jgi:hypothetical protein